MDEILRHIADFSEEGRQLLLAVAYGPRKLAYGFKDGEAGWELGGQPIEAQRPSELANRGLLEFPAIRKPGMAPVDLSHAGQRLAAILRRGAV
jgi:hypothetical protein